MFLDFNELTPNELIEVLYLLGLVVVPPPQTFDSHLLQTFLVSFLLGNALNNPLANVMGWLILNTFPSFLC